VTERTGSRRLSAPSASQRRLACRPRQSRGAGPAPNRCARGTCLRARPSKSVVDRPGRASMIAAV